MIYLYIMLKLYKCQSKKCCIYSFSARWIYKNSSSCHIGFGWPEIARCFAKNFLAECSECTQSCYKLYSFQLKCSLPESISSFHRENNQLLMRTRVNNKCLALKLHTFYTHTMLSYKPKPTTLQHYTGRQKKKKNLQKNPAISIQLHDFLSLSRRIYATKSGKLCLD